METRTLRPLAALVVLSALAVSPRAAASIHRDTSAGGACHAAAGGSTAFTFGNAYLVNKATTAQYVICQFTQLDYGNDHLSPERLDVYYNSGATGDTIACVVQVGYFWGVLQSSAWVTRSETVGPDTASALTWTSADLPRTTAGYTLMLNCKVPPGFKLGLIGLREPDPSSGTAWVP